MLKNFLLAGLAVLPMVLLGSCVVFAQPAVSAEDTGEEWTYLFPNSSLEKWTRTNTPSDTWSFENDVLICSGKPIGEIRTRRMFQNFVMELEWRHMVPGGNAGIFVWADDITAKGVPFHRGIEVQVLENDYGNTQSYTTHGDIFPIHGATMLPLNGRGGSRAFPTENRSKPSPQWNHYRIVAMDGEISLAVNGKVVTRGKECSPRRGYICIESEGGVVQYRNVRIQELPDTKISKSHVAIEDRGYTSIYSGLDLRGWKASGEGSWKSNDWILSYEGTKSGLGSLEYIPGKGSTAFLLDFRFGSDRDAVQIHGITTEPIDLADVTYRDHLAKQGRWNRLEVVDSGQGVTLKLNDHQLAYGENGDLIWFGTKSNVLIKAMGKVDFANVYQRDLQR